MKIFTAVLLSTLWLLACSSQPQQSSEEKIATTLEDMQLETGNKMETIRDYRVDSWRYIDQYNLVIEAGLKDKYLISLQSPCFGLNGAFGIGFTSTAGSLDKFEDIVVKGPSGRAERCPISDIVKLEPIPTANVEPTPE
jgi:hypothetical protein